VLSIWFFNELRQFITLSVHLSWQQDESDAARRAVPSASAEPCYQAYTVKDIRISTDILCWVVRILTKPVPYTFVSVNRLNNKSRAHVSLFHVDLLMQWYTEPVPLKSRRSLQNIREYMDIFTVYICIGLYCFGATTILLSDVILLSIIYFVIFLLYYCCMCKLLYLACLLV